MPRWTVPRPAGTLIHTDEHGRTAEWDTCRCVHCQRQWVVKPGSGRRRGFCVRCGGPTCGSGPCERECCHWEKRLERLEKGHR